MWFRGETPRMPAPDEAPPGRDESMVAPDAHFVNGASLRPPFPDGLRQVVFGMGCFWGAERQFWQTSGVHTTAVGYAGGVTPNPTYREVCGGMTGHTEVVLVVFDPTRVSLEELLRRFWEGHDPTQGMRQGNDVGTQYRSVIYCDGAEQLAAARQWREAYQRALQAEGHGDITTEVDGLRETHRVVGILFGDGERLGGERVYASERCVRLMTGELFDELTPLVEDAPPG